MTKNQENKNELIHERKSLILKKSIFILAIIAIIGLGIRLYYFSYEIPVTSDALTYFLHATDAIVVSGFPNTAVANNGWPLFLSLFFGLVQSNNFLDHSAVQQLLSISISVLTIIPVYLICKKFVKNEYALLGAGIFVLEPRIIQNSVLGITEPLYIILGSISLLFFLSNKISFTMVAFGFVAITTMVRAEGLFLLIPFSIMFFIKYKTEKKIILKFLLALGIFFIILSPMTLYKMDVRDGDDAIFGRVASSISDSSIIYKDNSQGFFEYVEKSVIKFLQFIGWIQIPVFIIFLPLGIFLIFKNRNNNSKTIILSISCMLIPAFYGISTGPDTRYLYFLYPMFCVISVLAIEKIVVNKKNSVKILMLIFIMIFLASSIFLSLKMNDIEYEKDAVKVAQFLVNNASGINDYHPEASYVRSTIVESEEYPKLAKNIQFDKVKKFNINYDNLEEFIENHRNEGLSHLVIDKKNNQFEFMNEIFVNEENYSYLKKEFDSSEFEMKYQVKIFQINYQEFDKKNSKSHE